MYFIINREGIAGFNMTNYSWIIPADEQIGPVHWGALYGFPSHELIANDQGLAGSEIQLIQVNQPQYGGLTSTGPGYYTYTPPNDPTLGTDSFSYVVGDQFGNTVTETATVSFASASSTTVATGDGYRPVITDVYDNVSHHTILDGDVTTDTAPWIGGSAIPLSTVTIFDNGVKIGETEALSSWQWSFIPETPLSEGIVHHITAESMGVPTKYTSTFAIGTDPVPLLTPVITDVSAESRPSIQGTSEPGTVVTLFDNNVQIGQVTTGADWQWSFKPLEAMTLGEHHLTAIADRTTGTSPTPAPYAAVLNIQETGISSDTGAAANAVTSASTLILDPVTATLDQVLSNAGLDAVTTVSTAPPPSAQAAYVSPAQHTLPHQEFVY